MTDDDFAEFIRLGKELEKFARADRKRQAREQARSAKRLRENQGRKKLGDFQLLSGKVMVTDPCYTRNTWCQALVSGVKKGRWTAYVHYGKAGGGDSGRCMALEVRAAGHCRPASGERLRALKASIGVDSGQAGVFDEALYPQGDATGDFGDTKSFYGKVCGLTLRDRGAGVLSYGAVSSSGWGDGSYMARVLRHGGEIVVIRIDF